ncbi:endo-1,4-beta-xylanase [candidate division KSB1 bacterium]|nr:endo-1,4-beta-xylanase [candidate division KSB1 bacterium]
MERYMKEHPELVANFAQTSKKLPLDRALMFVLLMVLIVFIATLSKYSYAQPLAQGHDKFLGCSTSSDLSRKIDDYFNQVTPGNDGKWGSVEGIQGVYSWSSLDKIYNFAKNRCFLFKEHTLIWGNQAPYWINSLDSARQREKIEEWIRRIGERYPDMAMVDVVNEPFNAPPSFKNALGGDGETGWDWVITAFELARQYCPTYAILILNEYNILHSNSATQNYLNLIKLLQDRELIDGIGVQGHYFEFRSDINDSQNRYVHNISTIKANLDRLAETGLPIYISEFDIDEPNDNDQSEQYQIYFPIFWSHPAVKGITFWGYIETDVWHSHPNTYLIRSDGSERPALQWMRTYINSPQPPVIISPCFTINELRKPVLKWRSSETATSYQVQLASDITFANVLVDTITVDTTLQILQPLEANRRHHWRVRAGNENGMSFYSNVASFTTGDQLSSVERVGFLPSEYDLYQNYPNPFNPTTTISFSIPQRSDVQIMLLNVLGETVMKITDGTFEAGVHHVQLHAHNVSSGIYFYKMVAGQFSKFMKLLVVQ